MRTHKLTIRKTNRRTQNILESRFRDHEEKKIKKNKFIHHKHLNHTLSIVINTVFHLARPDLVYIVNTIENVPVLNIIKLETYQTDLNNSFTHFVLIN